MDALADAPQTIEEFRAILASGRTLPPVEVHTDPPSPTSGATRRPQASRETGDTPGRRKAKRRFQTLNAFVDEGMRLVKSVAQAAWLVLFREVQSSGLAKMSFRQIAERIGVTRRTAIRAVKALEHAGLVTVVERGRMNGGSSTYRVHGRPKEAIA